MILERLVVGLLETNCYVVGAEVTREGMVIDPGDKARQIVERVEDLQLNIKFIVLTHGHIDHIAAARELKEATGAEVCVHPDDIGSFQGKRMSGITGLSYVAPPPADRLVGDGDSIDFDDLHFRVLHTPGHTPGGICLLGQGIVFTGDTLFNHGVGRTDLPGGNHRQLVNSLRSKLMMLPDETIVYPGHGPETTIGNERRVNPFLR